MWRLGVGDGDAEESFLGGEEEEEEDSDGSCTSLSYSRRLYGFAACLIAGLACMLLSLLVFAKPINFAVIFTFGNVLAVGSTAFLIKPVQQMRLICDPVRVFATSIYIGCVVIALVCALWIHSKVLTIIAIACEICALFWYSLSYIHFARRMVSELLAVSVIMRYRAI